MSTKTLAGSLLIIGPLTIFLLFGFLWDAVIGSPGENLTGKELIEETLKKGMANITLTKLLAILGLTGMLSMFLGYTLWGRLLQGEGKPGSTLATVAAITIPVVAAGMLFSFDTNFAAADAWDKGDTVNALILGAVAEYSGGEALWFFFSLSIGLIGIAHAGQFTATVHKSLGYTLAVVGFLMMVSTFVDLGDAVGFIVWIIMTLVTVFSGGLLLKTKAL